MKIRNGFVSNSSSSSFIVSDKNFPTVRSLATYMLNRQLNEYSEENALWKDEAIAEKSKYIKILEKIDENHPVSFPSCNYDTYIKKVGDCYLVGTCNNTQWNLYDNKTTLSENAKEELKKMQGSFIYDREYENIDELLTYPNDEFSHIGKDYFDLRVELQGVETYHDCPNKKNNKETHVGKAYYLWDSLKYGEICLICNPYFQRKDKLDQINKNGTI
jgi:hypothetical protein